MATTRGSEQDTPQPGVGAVAVADLSYSDAGAQLDSIIEEFETGVVDVDRLVEQLERATDIVDELDRRLRRTRMRVEELVPRLESIGRNDGSTGDGSDELGPGGDEFVPPTAATDGTAPGLF
ncbi:MAG TPA: exodeoxyribonuclease VII small subunit [Acidimicrobiales bacterium]|nr:exodeoxyribonuclease VII small subunit [Acidimicrobiales bacterium]